MKYLTLQEWYADNAYTICPNYGQLLNLPFEFQLGVYIKYFQDHGIVISAFNTGYLAYEVDNPIKWIIEQDNLEPKRVEEYWKIVVQQGFIYIANKIKEQKEPF